MRIAVIDLGTNTFNLLVIGWENNVPTKVYSSKISVRIGEGGFAEKKIKTEAFNRAILAFGVLINTAQDLGVEQVYAYATSAIRSASNGKDFAKAIYTKYKIKIDIISGDREAELIYKGVCSSGIMTDQPALIMDIGGGSTEFIIGTKNEILWKQSFPLGVARILELFKPSDPIEEVEITVISNFYSTAIENLFNALKLHKTNVLIGSSGSFDSLVDITCCNQNEQPKSEFNAFSEIKLADFHNLYNTLIRSTILERINMPGLIPLRVDFIVLAVVFIKLIIEKTPITTIWQSSHSLKEGVVCELEKTRIDV